MTSDCSRIERLTLRFAKTVCLTLNEMVDSDFSFNEADLHLEPFSTANGIIAFIHFGGTIQGDCILIFSEVVINKLIYAFHHHAQIETADQSSTGIEDFISEVLNTSMGQLMPSLEREIDALSYMPPIVISGRVTFPKVSSANIVLSGEAGTIMCIFSLNMVSQRIVETLKSVSENLEIKTLQASIDPLTGLKNRRYFDESFHSLIPARSNRGTILSIMILDIDNLKFVNDHFGHHIGDRVLIMTAKTIMSVLRFSDIPCRYGGDEIIVIMPNVTSQKAYQIAETIRKQLVINSAELIKDNPELHPVTLSIGIGQLQQDESPELLFKRTDQALYQAKRNGRNRIIISSPELYPSQN